MPKIFIAFTIFLITLFTAVGDSFLKKSSQLTGNFFNRYLLIGTIVYALTSLLWAYIYKYMKFSTSVTLYSIFSIIIFAFIGVFVFKESITIMEGIGIMFAVISLIILVRFG